jgi:hypothetical protein
VNDVKFLKEVLDFVKKTPELTRNNLAREAVCYPIPFFGNISSAEVLTVGVNPSNGEFAPPRQIYWPAGMTPNQLLERLRSYFCGAYPPHPWFEGWTESFRELDPRLSYTNGAVAHTDLSPRVTTPMSYIQDPLLFEKMIRTDIKFLFRILFENKKIRLIMTGGQVLGPKYIAQWIRNLAPKPLQLLPSGKGNRATSFYKFVGLGREVGLFSSGVGPTFRDQLIENVSANRDKLLDVLG